MPGAASRAAVGRPQRLGVPADDKSREGCTELSPTRFMTSGTPERRSATQSSNSIEMLAVALLSV